MPTLYTALAPMLSLAAHLQASEPATARDSVTVCVRDAATGAPLVGARLREADGATLVLRGDCINVERRVGPVQVARVGYVPQRIALLDASESAVRAVVVVWLVSRVGTGTDGDPTSLAPVRVTATVAPPAPAGALSASLTADAARERGVGSMNGLITLLPFTALRSARGESGVSLRGARREQVVITLDGLPLNDPATGVADVSDLPLVAVQEAVLRPGADPLGAGNGASGGVLALTSASQRLAAVRAGAFGHRAAEASWAAGTPIGRWHASLAHRREANDFPFVNAAGVSPVRETRVNNDETRTVLTAGLVSGRTQWNALVSTGDRGMVGPANVRAYDEDRSTTTRLLLRGQTALGASLVTTGLRYFSLGYHDPRQPALDARSRVWAADAEWRASAPIGSWRVGGGVDALAGTGNVRQQRARGVVAWMWQRAPLADTRVSLDAGLRADAVERSGIQPSASAGLTWRLLGSRRGSSVAWLARMAQAVRVPTLYDLYFSSPQRLSVRALDPERVRFDASSGAQGVWQRHGVRVTGEALLVARDTRDAIIWFPGNFGWSPANVGRERLHGTEARAEVAVAGLGIHVWHTWYASTLRSGALTIPTPYVPQHAAGGQARWQWGPQTLSTNVRIQGRRPFTAGPRDPRFELPAVTVADMAWARQHDLAYVRALVSVALENVTDVQWQSVRGFPMPGRGWSVALTLQPRP